MFQSAQLRHFSSKICHLVAVLFLLGFHAFSAGAQTGHKVTGIVTDSEGEALSGVIVRIIGEGDKAYAVTDARGFYSINVSKPSTARLEFSSMGLQTLEVSLGGKEKLNVTLVADKLFLDDAVVVGYGTTKRKDLTGSVSTVSVADLKTRAVSTVDDLMLGKAAGVQVTKADGAPGGGVRVRIRGGASLQRSVDPLYIIDGIPTEVTNDYIAASSDLSYMYSATGSNDIEASGEAYSRTLNSLSGLNPNDIESMTILKDASATAIYGSKAANGVVIITTKRGTRNSKPRVNFNYNYTLGVPQPEEVLSGDEYISAYKNAISNTLEALAANRDNIVAYRKGTSQYDSLINKLKKRDNELTSLSSINQNTDWLSLLLRNSAAHNADVSLAGGSETSRYYASLSYTNQEGTIINTSFDRFTGKISMDTDITKKLRSVININFGATTNNVTNGSYGQALAAPSVLPAYAEDGSYAKYTQLDQFSSIASGFSSSYLGYQNPLAVASAINTANTYSFKGTVGIEYDVIDDLVFKSNVSYDLKDYNQSNYIPSYLQVGTDAGVQQYEGGSGTEAHSLTKGFFWDNTLTYNKIFAGIHHVDVVLGHAWETRSSSWFSASGVNYPDDKYLNGLSSAVTPASVKGANPSVQNALLSFYARVNYTLMDKYLFTFTGRSDTSSKFSKANRTGYFPSGAIAWRISEENFLKNVKWLDELKVRASLGKTGTQNIDDYMYLTLFTPNSYAGTSALYPSQLGNDSIKWETTVQKDLGLDFSLFKGRLGGVLSSYWKTTDDALYNISVAPSSGFSSAIANYASIENKGLELELYGDIIRTKDFNWHVNFNISKNVSKVLKLSGGSEYINGATVLREGEPLGLLYAYVAEGVIHTQEELDAYKARFNEFKENWWVVDYPTLGIGSPIFSLRGSRYRDYKDVVGNCTPDFYGGFNTQFSYKNWSLSAAFTYSYGNELLLAKDVSDMKFDSVANRSKRILSNDPERPKVYAEGRLMLSSLNVYDASYLRMNSLSLSYAIPANLLKAINVSSASIYVAGGNLLTLTKYPGADPAITDDPFSISGGGLDLTTYPTSKTFTAGIRLGF